MDGLSVGNDPIPRSAPVHGPRAAPADPVTAANNTTANKTTRAAAPFGSDGPFGSMTFSDHPVGRHRSRDAPVGSDHLMISVTRPEPTVRPPSRIAKPRPGSMAIGWMSSTVISVVSPGMTMSVPSGRVMTPVTSVVRK